MRKLYDSISGHIDLLQSLKEDLVKFNEMDTERKKFEISLKTTETEITSLIQVISKLKAKHIKREDIKTEDGYFGEEAREIHQTH